MGGGALQAESRTQQRTRFLFSFPGCLAFCLFGPTQEPSPTYCLGKAQEGVSPATYNIRHLHQVAALSPPRFMCSE